MLDAARDYEDLARVERSTRSRRSSERFVFLFVAQPLIAAASSTVGRFLFGNALTAVGAAVAVSLAWTVLALALAGWVDDRREIA